MKRNIWLFLTTLTVTLILLTPGALQWVFGALLLAGLMALAVVGFLFCAVVAAAYRNRAARAIAEWPDQIDTTDEPTPARIERQIARNGHYEQ